MYEGWEATFGIRILLYFSEKLESRGYPTLAMVRYHFKQLDEVITLWPSDEFGNEIIILLIFATA